MFLSHPRIKPESIELRAYQENIAKKAMEKSTLVVLPTGMGKTVIALRIIAEMVDKGKVLFLAPTKPLVEQHYRFLKDFLILEPKDANLSEQTKTKRRKRFDPLAPVQIFTGEMPPEARSEGWKNARIVVSTPQVIENDIISGRMSLDDVSLIVFDEVHRAAGDYSYVFVAQQYRSKGLVLGMTASPGYSVERITGICDTLGIENIEIRTEYDPDVRPYVHNIYLEWVEVEVHEDMKRIVRLLKDVMNSKISELKSAGLLPENVKAERILIKDLLDVQSLIQSKIAESSPNPPPHLFHLASIQSATMKVAHAIELAETQGIPALKSYFERLGEDRSKGAAMLRNDPRFVDAILITKHLDIEKVDHPKVERLTGVVLDQISKKPDSRIIVFSQYRDSVDMLLKKLSENPVMKPVKFIGQADRGGDKGLTQRQQAEIIEGFRANQFNILVSTSIGEEGLDIPQVDLVIFYEPVPSEIRSIQRRGRTGRKRPGRVVILITKGTRDEAYYWSGRAKEKRMRGQLELLREQLQRKKPLREEKKGQEKKGQLSLSEFPGDENKIHIVADNRELNSGVIKHLIDAGAVLEPGNLEVGDYVLSDRCCVERKEALDFLNSIIDGRLFQQMNSLKAYERPILLIEGENITTLRSMNPSAVYAALGSIAVDFGIPIIQTRNSRETASLLYAIAKKEQTEEKRPIRIRGEKPQMSHAEWQQFIVEGLPDISTILAKRLLAHFGSVKRIIEAGPEELQEVEGIGPITAERIVRIVSEMHPEFKEKTEGQDEG